MNKEITKKVGVWFLAFVLFLAHLFFRSVAHADTPNPVQMEWKQVYTKGGDCAIAFPTAPQLIQQSLNLS
jgi:hypothetical protein